MDATVPTVHARPLHATPPGPSPGFDDWRDLLDAHRAWVESGGNSGSPADLRRLNLSGFDLRNVCLSGADLTGADLRGVDLNGADLQKACLVDARLPGANLTGARLSGADLTGADLTGADLVRADLRAATLRQAVLRDANMMDADLSDALGLLPGQLGGANTAGAKLPPAILPFEGLSNIAEASKTSQGLFTSMIFVCAYTWLTIASTTDAQLLNNAAPASSRLPVLGIDIPLVRFYMVAPLLLLSLYIYFHLCLQRLWEEFADLPAVFPDGRPLDRKAYPWLMNNLIRTHAPRLREDRSHLVRWQARISSHLAWGLVPATILVLWERYLRAHDWMVSTLHTGLLAIAIGIGFGFLRLASSTLRGAERRPALGNRAWTSARLMSQGVTAGSALVLGAICYGAIEGVIPGVVWSADLGRALAERYSVLDPRRWVPAALEAVGCSTSAILYDANLSIKPANWSPQKPDLDNVHGADLENRNLRFARAYNAFMVNAYLHNADLRWGDFRDADLRRADLRGARLEGVNFRDAELGEADLRRADLHDARLYDTDLDRARLNSADLRRANLERAALQGSDLSEADLTGATLKAADLSPFTKDPAGAAQPSKLVKAHLRGADLSGADLTGADLTGADLRAVNLTGTALKGAILDGADLSGAIGLTREQLASARLDRRTRLPGGGRTAPERLAMAP